MATRRMKRRLRVQGRWPLPPTVARATLRMRTNSDDGTERYRFLRVFVKWPARLQRFSNSFQAQSTSFS
eukprot:5592652-Pyramimonas_sp.AAC.1